MYIDIVIPNYNGKKYLQDCLTSIQLQTHKEFTVIVVDNGSSDGSVELLTRDFPGVRVVALKENTGFSAAVNMGISVGSAPLVFLLNNDTELDPKCLSEFLNAAKSHPEFDFFASKMLNYYDHGVLDGAGDAFLRGGVGYRTGTMEKDSPFYQDAKQVFGACAGAALYRRDVFERIGWFDNDFFAYLEDVDLNFRANSRGKKCWYVPTAKVYHIGSATTGSKINDFTVRLSTKNNLNILLKNYPFILLLRFFPVIIVYQFCWFCFVVKKSQFAAYCAGLISFIKGIPVMFRKRAINLNLQTIKNGELASIMCAAEKEAILSIMKRRAEKGKGNLLFTLYLRLFL